MVFKNISNNTIGWFLAILFPTFIYIYGQHIFSDWAVRHFVVIFAAAIVLWMFRLIPEYVTTLFILLAVLMLGLVPEEVILSGFISNAFFIVLSIFGIGAVIIESGLFYRISLLMLRHLPSSPNSIQFFLYLIGLALTPILTSQSTRVALTTPLITELINDADLKNKPLIVSGLAVALYMGSNFFASIFLTGRTNNLALYGMLPDPIKAHFTWIYWLIAALVPGILIFFISIIQIRYNFSTREKIRVNTSVLDQKLAKLGNLKPIEWVAIMGTSILMLGFLFSSILKVNSEWLGFAVLFILLASNFLTQEQFKSDINWPFLFYLGGIIGIIKAISYLQIDQLISQHLTWFSILGDHNIYIFIAIVYLVTFAMNFIFGNMGTPALVYILLFPVAESIGFNLWLLSFIILFASESWLFPYQASYYLNFEEYAQKNPLIDQDRLLKINAWFVLYRLVIVFGSVWYWKYLGIL